MKNKSDILLLYLTWYLKSNWMRQVAGRINCHIVPSEGEQMANCNTSGIYIFISRYAGFFIIRLIYLFKKYVSPAIACYPLYNMSTQ